MEVSKVGSLFPWLLPSWAGSVLTTSLGLYQEPSPSLSFLLGSMTLPVFAPSGWAGATAPQCH